jgi:hypothetical protein
MDETQRAAFLMSQAAAAMIQAMGIGHNAAVTWLLGQ